MTPDPDAPAGAPDWLPILDAELAALPAKYRDALVLCELQGASRADAAMALGVREGTLSSRLSRGRDLLRRRLLKHGTLLPTGGLVALFSANGVGRATVPAALLARTSELMTVATGAASAGAVPVGAARLTDEVLKSMFLTKLRAAGAALVVLAAATLGFSAALPDDAPPKPPVPPEGKGTASKAPDVQPAKKAAPAGPKVADRDALQGLWVLEKCEASKDTKADELLQIKGLIGRMRFFVAGDTWWSMLSNGQTGDVLPQAVKLDPTKNPKWVDLTTEPNSGFAKCIYDLDGDRLRLGVVNEGDGLRPAEFDLTGDVPMMIMEFRRGKVLPAAGEKGLLGEWTGGENDRTKVVALDNYLFYTNPADRNGGWSGGSYTVDATKNPKWIEVELTAPAKDGASGTKLYGSYELIDGRLQMALGAKKTTRPLDFKGGNDTLVFDLKPNDATPGAKLKPIEAPMPKGVEKGKGGLAPAKP